jgi:hypothetical protein
MISTIPSVLRIRRAMNHSFWLLRAACQRANPLRTVVQIATMMRKGRTALMNPNAKGDCAAEE